MCGTSARFYWAGTVLDRKEGGKGRLECGPCSCSSGGWMYQSSFTSSTIKTQD